MSDPVALYELRNMVALAYWTLTDRDHDAADAIYRRFGHWNDVPHKGRQALRNALDAYNAALADTNEGE